MNDSVDTSPSDRSPPPFPRWLLLALVATATVVIGSGVMIALRPKPLVPNGRIAPASSLSPDEGLEDLAIPTFTLVDQNGGPVTEAVFEGHLTILDFSFTNCPFVCPGMTAAMISLQTQLAGTGVRFASISVDPSNDTPEVIKAHADRIGVDHTRWTWLTGDESEIRRIVSESLKFELRDDPSRVITRSDGSTMNNIMHPSRLFLVGPDRQLLALYQFNDNEALESLKRRAIECTSVMSRR